MVGLVRDNLIITAALVATPVHFFALAPLAGGKDRQRYRRKMKQEAPWR